MDPLAAIWDAPVAPKSPPRPSRTPLFIQGSDDENDRMPDAPPRRTADPDVDALFSEVANLSDEHGDGADPTGTPHPILSSSPAHHLDGNAGGEQDKDGPKPKKKTMRLDEGRLVGDSGFPQLIQDTKSIRIKGKGHEARLHLCASDLNRLLQVYQFWTHRLYPKTPFKDTVDRVEKICHSKRMHNMLGQWRDEAHGIVNGKKPGEEDEDDGGGASFTVDSSLPGPDSDQADYASSSSHAATRPPSSVEGDGDEDEVEFDAAAMDASARLNAQQTDSDMDDATRDTAFSDADASRGMTDEDDEQLLWQELHEAGPSKPAHVPAHTNEEDDEDLWALVEEATNATVPKPTVPTVLVVAQDPPSDEEEGWNMVNELDTSAAAPVPLQPKLVSSVEEDYEDMYMDGS
ncbi:replication fork protection component Swi3-domain-containing protein [Mycena rosella]|uniref:Chromosome segregation in meiosis protein n=1 Tax=Mycena rosella TaxID=1033263 RepID=A0AAD7H220_MYCRO|nr:replication fork protection component Swi3-domain-containing protein [Mycena rosella]